MKIDFNQPFFLVCDVDGTLYNDESKINKENKNLLQRYATNKNFNFVVATGRMHYQLKECYKQLEFPKPFYVVAGNGSHVFRVLSTKIIEELYKLKIPNVKNLFHLILQVSNRSYYFGYESLIDYDTFRLFDKKRVLNYIDKNEVLKIWVYLDKEKKEINSVLKHLDHLKKTKQINYYLHKRHQPQSLEITCYIANKANGIIELMKHKGIESKNQVIIIGDGKNDLEMLNYFPNSFCVANNIIDPKLRLKHVKVLKESNNEFFLKSVFNGEI